MGAGIGIIVELAVDYFEDDSRTLNHNFLDYLGAAVGGAISGGMGASKKVFVRLAGSIIGSIAQGAISKNKDYSLESFGQDVGIGVISFGISEGLRIFGEKVVKDLFKIFKKGASRKVAGELYTFSNIGKEIPTFTSETKNIINGLNALDVLKDVGEKFGGALYSFFNSLGHGSIFVNN